MYTNLQKALEKLFVTACNFRSSSYYSKRVKGELWKIINHLKGVLGFRRSSYYTKRVKGELWKIQNHLKGVLGGLHITARGLRESCGKF
jgi:hypothetical protein